MIRHGKNCAVKVDLDQGIVMIFFDDLQFFKKLMTWIFDESRIKCVNSLFWILVKVEVPCTYEDANWRINYENYLDWIINCKGWPNTDESINYKYVVYIPNFEYIKA